MQINYFIIVGWKLEKEKPCPLGANVSENMPYFVATSDLKTGHVLFQRKVKVILLPHVLKC